MRRLCAFLRGLREYRSDLTQLLRHYAERWGLSASVVDEFDTPATSSTDQ